MTRAEPGSPGAGRVCAIVVTYHPDAGFPGRCAAIAGQVGSVGIVDNGSAPAEVEMLRWAKLKSVAAGVAHGLIFNPEDR